MVEIAGGEAGPLLLAEEKASVPRNQPVRLRPERLNLVIGCDIPRDATEAILERLGMDVTWNEDHWIVTAPSARFDIEIEEDLIEEVARIYGYNVIPEAPVSGELAAGNSSGHRVSLVRVREALCSAGYQEAINYSFVDRNQLESVHHNDQVLPLANPLSSDMDVMRTTLLPGLLTSLARNIRRQQPRVRLFETGVAFLQGDVMNEVGRLAGIATGEALPEQWGEAARTMDFFDLKGDVERLYAMKGDTGRPLFEPASDMPWMHPGASARIKLDGVTVGWCGEVHPTVLKAFEIKKSVFAFELDLENLLQREVPFTKNISRFPSVRRDLALLLANDTSYARVRECIIAVAGPYLEKVTVFDVYEGDNLKEGYKSLAIGLIFNNVSSTLKDEDIDPVIETIVSELEQHLGAQLRG